MDVPELSPAELKAELEGSNPPIVVDVREPHELEISGLPDVIHIPLNDLPERVGELDSNANMVIVCRTGGRSGKATAFLLGQGFTQVRNMATGMNGWASTVDPSMPQY